MDRNWIWDLSSLPTDLIRRMHVWSDECPWSLAIMPIPTRSLSLREPRKQVSLVPPLPQASQRWELFYVHHLPSRCSLTIENKPTTLGRSASIRTVSTSTKAAAGGTPSNLAASNENVSTRSKSLLPVRDDSRSTMININKPREEFQPPRSSNSECTPHESRNVIRTV